VGRGMIAEALKSPLHRAGSSGGLLTPRRVGGREDRRSGDRHE
jgi:hypothetical protein